MLPVQKGVPIPPRKQGTRIYPFTTMEIGDFFFLPGATSNILATRACKVGKAMSRTYVTRKISCVKDEDGRWFPLDECDLKDYPEAIAGVGVWRMA